MPLFELVDIEKSFGDVVALQGASLRVPPGTIHALLGENGAGKTTLMRIAFGSLQPDRGRILIDGMPQSFRSTAVSTAAGVGMIHQHFSLVPSMTVAENVSLGRAGRYRQRIAIDTVEQLSAATGLQLDAHARVGDLSVGGQQRVEILKALSRDARLLILDEPTAVLPPGEALSLLDWIRNFAQGGRSAVLVTHKVREALRIADHVTVLRRGRAVFSGAAKETNELDLARVMVEQAPVVTLRTRASTNGSSVLTLEDVEVSSRGRTMLHAVSLTLRRHELLGVAGVEGSGYRDLLRVVAGRIRPARGRREGSDSIGFIPEDRHREGLALEFTASENVALRGAGRRRGFMNWTALGNRTRALASEYDIRGPLEAAPTRALSGGNQQKLILARELSDDPGIIVAENPTRGLDLHAAAAVRNRLLRARDRGAAVVMYSADIEELLSVADRIVVVHAGRVTETPVDLDAVTAALVGLSA